MMASWGVFSSACRAMVNSTTPRLAPRCPPFSEMVLMISSRTLRGDPAKRVRVQRPQVVRQLKLIEQPRGRVGHASGLLDSHGPGQTPKHPVDQGPGFVGTETLGGSDRLVDDYGRGDFGFPQELVGR